MVLLLGLEALAQEPQVPAELLKPRRRLQGNQITFCVNSSATLLKFDRAVGEAIASALLMKPKFIERDYSGFGLLDDGDLFTNLFIDLTNSCDAFIGLNLAAGVYPDWLTFSRPYARVPYVLAVKNPAYKRLEDIPRGKAIGSGLGTAIDAEFGAYLRNLPGSEAWQRIPYGDFALMLTRLKDGTLEGALLWAPVLNRLTQGDPAAQGLYVASTLPIKTVESELGIALRARDVFLRTMLDNAIVAILKDGTAERMLTANHIMGRPASSETRSQAIRPIYYWLTGLVALLGAGMALLLRSRNQRRVRQR